MAVADTILPSLYKPLPTGYFRLLELHGTCLAGSEDDRIRDLAITCSLHEVSFESVLSGETIYGALSYVWGSRQLMRPVICNGHQVMVTGNLYNALWKFIFNDDPIPGLLWVDALCIDQADNADRSHQVAAMKDIYSRAEKVLVWLGAASEVAPEHLMEFMTMINEQTDETDRDDHLKSILQSLNWFKRVWTFQEIVLAHNAEVHWGPYCTSWAKFASFFQLQLGDTQISTIEDLRNGSVAPTLTTLLAATEGRVATQAYDHLFGVLGLWNGPGLIRPDYSLSFREICAESNFIIALEERHIPFVFAHRQQWNGPRMPEPFQDGKDPDHLFLLEPRSWITSINLKGWESYQRRHAKYAVSARFGMNLQLEGTELVARGVILGRWVTKTDEGAHKLRQPGRFDYDVGDFQGFPLCVTRETSTVSFASLEELTGSNIFDQNKPIIHEPRYVQRLLMAHAQSECGCPIKQHEDQPNRGMATSKYWLCIIFGSHFPVVLRLHTVSAIGDVKFSLHSQLHGFNPWMSLIVTAYRGDLSRELHYKPTIFRKLGRLNWIPSTLRLIGDLPMLNVTSWDD